MYIIDKKNEEVLSIPTKEISLTNLKKAGSKLAQKIINELSSKPMYPKEIADKIKENEQKVYYHIRKLEKAKIIQKAGSRIVGGATANLFSLSNPSFFVRFRDFEETQKIDVTKPKTFLDPFIEEGKLNSTIIVGSPDPHGPQKARSRDGYYAIDLALFLGTFLNYVPELNVRLDTETRQEHLQNNIIVIGGPIVNTISSEINKRLPIKFDDKDNLNIYSSISGKRYMSDETGIIVKDKNPFNPKKKVLFIAGKRHSGTRAVMIAFLRYFDSLVEGNNYNQKLIAKVVEGIDVDSDGIVDEIEILE